MEWYQDLFCRDLELCNRIEQGWGAINFDKTRVIEIAEYYLSHPEFAWHAREVLVESVLKSFQGCLIEGAPDPRVEEVMCRLVAHAIADPYDRDMVRIYWRVEDSAFDPNPLYHWIRGRFPDWTPPPSIWLSKSGGSGTRDGGTVGT